MIKSCVTISLVPSLRGGPWVYWDAQELSIPKAGAQTMAAFNKFPAGNK